MIEDHYDARRYLDNILYLDANYVPTILGEIFLFSNVDHSYIGKLVKTTPLDIDRDTTTMKLFRKESGYFQYTISHKRLDYISFQVI
jgi:hypothetical protein